MKEDNAPLWGSTKCQNKKQVKVLKSLKELGQLILVHIQEQEHWLSRGQVPAIDPHSWEFWILIIIDYTSNAHWDS